MPEQPLAGLETAYTRSVLLAVELLDAVTLAPVWRGVRVSAPPLSAAPIVNASGRFVWLLAGAQRPARVVVDPGALPYEREQIDAPALPDPLPAQAPRLARVWLRPRRGYSFPDGVTVLRGRLEHSAGAPQRPLANAEVWIEWLDAGDGKWHDQRARMHTRSRDDGEFAAFLRMAPGRLPVDKNGLMRLRLGFRSADGEQRHSKSMKLRDGAQAAGFPRYAWDDLKQ